MSGLDIFSIPASLFRVKILPLHPNFYVMEVLTLSASPRTDLGKTATKAIRKADRIPCVLYGGSEIQHFTVAPLDLRKLVYSPEFKVVEIDLDGATHRCILK